MTARPRTVARMTALSLVLTAGTAGAASLRDLPTEVLCDLIDDAEAPETEHPERARVLSLLTEDQRATVRAQVAAAMGSLWPNAGADATDELRRLARDTSDNVRVSAAVGLARWGVAESGSVALHSGPDSPVLLAFLPLHHMVVLPVEGILPHLEDYAAVIDGEGRPPRNAILITGPSGTTDIEGSYVRGAHGPGFVHIVLVDGPMHTMSHRREASTRSAPN